LDPKIVGCQVRITLKKCDFHLLTYEYVIEIRGWKLKFIKVPVPVLKNSQLGFNSGSGSKIDYK